MPPSHSPLPEDKAEDATLAQVLGVLAHHAAATAIATQACTQEAVVMILFLVGLIFHAIPPLLSFPVVVVLQYSLDCICSKYQY
jgi:hypothetical protein